ncbi:hypothetical protein IF1G_05385 [Cordyceps javanica]|uniref:Uncharacterized protein n=1 Tax=Cordyceps javanica TaxID=43265 RepID=A0A545V1G7_9HYPO|nr:hypothetical protein IF1G_05385 [Cordyceps javanica]
MIQRVHDVTLPSQPPRAKVCTFCIIYSHESEKKKELIQQRQTRITLCMAGGSSTCLNVPLKREQVTEQWGRAPESVVGRHALRHVHLMRREFRSALQLLRHTYLIIGRSKAVCFFAFQKHHHF